MAEKFVEKKIFKSLFELSFFTPFKNISKTKYILKFLINT